MDIMDSSDTPYVDRSNTNAINTNERIPDNRELPLSVDESPRSIPPAREPLLSSSTSSTNSPTMMGTDHPTSNDDVMMPTSQREPLTTRIQDKLSSIKDEVADDLNKAKSAVQSGMEQAKDSYHEATSHRPSTVSSTTSTGPSSPSSSSLLSPSSSSSDSNAGSSQSAQYHRGSNMTGAGTLPYDSSATHPSASGFADPHRHPPPDAITTHANESGMDGGMVGQKHYHQYVHSKTEPKDISAADIPQDSSQTNIRSTDTGLTGALNSLNEKIGGGVQMMREKVDQWMGSGSHQTTTTSQPQSTTATTTTTTVSNRPVIDNNPMDTAKRDDIPATLVDRSNPYNIEIQKTRIHPDRSS